MLPALPPRLEAVLKKIDAAIIWLSCAIDGCEYKKVRDLAIGGILIECVVCEKQRCYHPLRGMIPYDEKTKHFERQIIAIRRYRE